MKKIIIFFVVIFSFQIYSQIEFEDSFIPHERDREPGSPRFSNMPLYESPMSSVFFNINISQQFAPQNEPTVCISRKDPNRVVAAWRDFRLGIDPVANRKVGYSYSTNGGLTWSISALLDSTLIPGFTRNSDPVLTVDTAGNFYLAVITITFPTGELRLAVYKSTNGGVSFPFATQCTQGLSDDKDWIESDLNISSPFVNNLYIGWSSGTPFGVMFIKSTDGAANWSAPLRINDDNTTFGSGVNVCISRNGQINVVWKSPNKIIYDRSTDGGISFGSDIIIDTSPVGFGTSMPSIAVDKSNGPRSGYLYAVFEDARFGDRDVFLSRSIDNGTSWSSLVRVNNDMLGNGKLQYWGAVAVNETGNIAIIFYDTRNTSNNSIFEAYLARSYDGGVTFTNELISSEPSPTNIPGGNVRFGDYIDIDYVGQNIVPVWTDERAGGFNMDIFSAEITEVLATDPVTAIPTEYELMQNYPNPFNPATTIRFALPEASFVTLEVYNSMGQLVKTLSKGTYQAGNHSVGFNAGNLSSGVYFYKLTSGSFSETKKMMLIK